MADMTQQEERTSGVLNISRNDSDAPAPDAVSVQQLICPSAGGGGGTGVGAGGVRGAATATDDIGGVGPNRHTVSQDVLRRPSRTWQNNERVLPTTHFCCTETLTSRRAE